MAELPTTMLVRRAAPQGTTSLLEAAGLTAGAVESAAARGCVFVLGDVSQPPTSPPIAALAIDVDERGRAMVIGIVVISPLRRRGLGRRLLVDAITLLQADGVRSIQALAGGREGIASLLRSAGFALDTQYREDEVQRFVREL